MAALPERTGLSGSLTPLSGTPSVFTDEMLRPSDTSPLTVDSVGAGYPEEYTLNDLVPPALQVGGQNEDTAKNWVEGMVKRIKNTSVSANCRIPSMLLQPFHHNYVRSPDVTVTKYGLAISSLQVVSCNAYLRTVSKAVLNCIEMLRVWRTYNTSVDECTSFVVPNAEKASCVMEVTVKFEPFFFLYSMNYVKMRDVALRIKSIITGWQFVRHTALNSLPFLIRLRPEECDIVETGAVQVFSASSFILQANTAFWKFNRKASRLYSLIVGQSLILARHGQRKFQFTLLPILLKWHACCPFYKFHSLRRPLSRDEAKNCLLPLLDGLHCALEELHSEKIAHLDVRLPNICFGDDACVTLVDLDQCDYTDLPCGKGIMYHHMSDMYKSPQSFPGEWSNRHADMKSVGMMMCFILDSELNSACYHYMISRDMVDEQFCQDPFIKNLLQKGEWDDATYVAFKTKHHILNEPIPRN